MHHHGDISQPTDYRLELDLKQKQKKKPLLETARSCQNSNCMLNSYGDTDQQTTHYHLYF